MSTSRTIAINDGSVQVRRISWAELYRLRPDLKPANDNVQTPMSALPRFQASGDARNRQAEAA